MAGQPSKAFISFPHRGKVDLVLNYRDCNERGWLAKFGNSPWREIAPGHARTVFCSFQCESQAMSAVKRASEYCCSCISCQLGLDLTFRHFPLEGFVSSGRSRAESSGDGEGGRQKAEDVSDVKKLPRLDRCRGTRKLDLAKAWRYCGRTQFRACRLVPLKFEPR